RHQGDQRRRRHHRARPADGRDALYPPRRRCAGAVHDRDRAGEPGDRCRHAAPARDPAAMDTTIEAAAIAARGVGKTYVSGRTGETVEALRDVGFAVRPGEFVAVVGPSGCGKSTLLSLIAGFARPSTGEVLFDGKPIDGPGPERGVMFQDYALFPWRTVLGNVEFGPLARGIDRGSRREDAMRYIELVGLG